MFFFANIKKHNELYLENCELKRKITTKIVKIQKPGKKVQFKSEVFKVLNGQLESVNVHNKALKHRKMHSQHLIRKKILQ